MVIRAPRRLWARPLDRHLESGPQMLQYHAIADRIASDGPEPVLDWGCGYGQVTALLAERGVSVTAFDYRGNVAAPTTAPLDHFPGMVAHVSPDPVRLPFGDATFAAVLSCGVLEHVQDPDGSVREIRRVLRPGGTFYVYNLPNRWSYTEKIARALGLYYHGRLPDDRVYTLASAQNLLARHGFALVEARRAHMLPLVLGGPAGLIWRTSNALERIPGLNVVATTIELVATAPA
jgi:ubiquinone/menaquinone biosynthesis C-methylase UbiE